MLILILDYQSITDQFNYIILTWISIFNSFYCNYSWLFIFFTNPFLLEQYRKYISNSKITDLHMPWHYQIRKLKIHGICEPVVRNVFNFFFCQIFIKTHFYLCIYIIIGICIIKGTTMVAEYNEVIQLLAFFVTAYTNAPLHFGKNVK